MIGGNLGPRERIQKEALRAVEESCGPVFTSSSLYESAPWGFDHERYFLNRVIGVDTSHTPLALLEELLAIEDTFGRERQEEGVYQGRILDLDILYYEERIVWEERLKIPHPKIPERRFTLEPLNEVAPEMTDPLTEKSVRTMIRECEDPLGVKVFEKGWITST